MNQYLKAFVKASDPITWPLYMMVSVLTIMFGMLILFVVDTHPGDMTVAEMQEFAQAIELLGWVGSLMLFIPVLFGLLGVAAEWYWGGP